MDITRILLAHAITACLACAVTAAAAPSPKPDCGSLTETVSAARWLTIPHSRLVLNPAGGYDFLPMKPPIPEGLGPGLTTNLAYWEGGGEPVKLPMFWSWQVVDSTDLTHADAMGESIDLLRDASVSWSDVDVASTPTESGLSVTLAKKGFGHAEASLRLDLNKTPFVVVSARPVNGARWALKVNDGTLATDIYLRGDTADSGDFVFDVRKATGWSGEKTVLVRVFVVGEAGATVDFPSLQCTGPRAAAPALITNRITWAPHRTVAEASTSQGARLTASTFFPSESAVAQTVKVSSATPVTLVLLGYFPEGEVSWDADRRLVLFASPRIRAALAVGGDARWMGVSPSCEGAVSGDFRASSGSGMWALAVHGLADGSTVPVVASFSPSADSTSDPCGEVLRLADVNALAASLSDREKAWNSILARVPRPASFALTGQPSRGITSDTMMKAYYRAWVFLMDDILPPMPENDFPYPQVTCGKPSLWSEGHPRCRGSAQWESIVAMQFTACVDPESTWKAFEGMLSCVDEQGQFGGEGLPARHFQTAWMLYTETGDADRLRRAYPAMKRLLQWKIDDPRWIYKGLTPSGMKDIEFVYHALMDLMYAQRVTDALAMPQETAYWQTQSKTLAANFREWFWEPKPESPVYRIFDPSQPESPRSAPGNSWSIPAIVLPRNVLGDRLESILSLTRSTMDPGTSFLFPNLTKHPSLSYTMHGMYQYGMADKTLALAEAIMRDVTAAGEFSECYVQTFPPRTTGVTPSNFGAMNIIDAAIWRNGVMYGDGLPVIVRLPGSLGVSNLSVRGRKIDANFGPNDAVTISGAGLPLLARPHGFRQDARGWTGVLKVGETLPLAFAH